MRAPCACGCGLIPKNWKAGYVAGHRPPRPLAERLAARLVAVDSGCIEWTGYRRPLGYGEIGVGRRDEGTVATHRAAWELAHGPIPAGMFVCHRCDNPPCCNVDHLFLGTCADNVADMVAKGRGARGDRLPHTKLSDDDVARLRRIAAGGGVTQQQIAAAFGVSQPYVSQLLAGKYRGAA